MIFLTGATGLVGSFVAKQLVGEGYTVKCLVRPAADKKLLEDIHNNIVFVEGDIMDISLLRAHLKGVDCIIHCAAIISYCSNKQDLMFNTNVVGTANVVNAALECSVRKMIHVSSVAALGRKEGVTRINEHAKWEESPNNTGYGRSKYFAELEVWRGAEEGLQVSIVNPSIILGAGDTAKSSTKLFDYVYRENLFYTDGNINYVDVKDVAKAIATLVKEDHLNEQFILNGGTTSIKNFFEKIAHQVSKTPPHIKANRFILALGWRLGAIYSFFTNKEPTLTKETSRISKFHYEYIPEKSIDKLKLKYTPLEESIRWTCQMLWDK